MRAACPLRIGEWWLMGYRTRWTKAVRGDCFTKPVYRYRWPD